jgi:hypothetical protein
MSLGLVDSVMLEKSTQRKIPLLIHGLLLLVLIKKSILSEKYPELNLFFVASLVSTIFAMILVFFKQKASLHMVGIVGLTVFVMALSYIFQIRMILPVVILLLTCGFVASSRLYMKAHTNRELLQGSLVGALPQILLVWMPEIHEFFQKIT